MSNDQDRKVFVGGLNIQTDTEGLRNYFSQFGEVIDAVVMTNPQTNRSKCFGFVTFGSSDIVDIVQSKRPHKLDGKTVDTKRAIPKEDPSPESRVPCKKLFVGGLKKSVTEDDLRQYFSNYGTIVECQLILDKVTKQSRGFGFVTYEDTDSVDKVIVAKPHTVGLDSKADVKKALSKEEMNAMSNKKPTAGGGGGPGVPPGAPNFQSNYGGGPGFQGGHPMQNAWGGMQGYGAGATNPTVMGQQGGWDPSQMAAAAGGAGYGQYGAQGTPGAANAGNMNPYGNFQSMYGAGMGQPQAAAAQQPWGVQPQTGWHPQAAAVNAQAAVGGFGGQFQYDASGAGGGPMKTELKQNRMGPY